MLASLLFAEIVVGTASVLQVTERLQLEVRIEL